MSDWSHVLEYLLYPSIVKTFFLLFFVGTLTLVFGVGAAWVCTNYKFFASRWLSRFLILPLFIPGYVLGFIYIGMLDYSGPVQETLRGFGIQTSFSIRSFSGLIFVLSFALFPYVYLFTRQGLLTCNLHWKESAYSLGLSPLKTMTKVLLPLLWPWMGSGLLFVLLEVLADFGTVSLFNYDTLTIVIYKVWEGFGALKVALWLSLILASLALVGVAVHQWCQGQVTYNDSRSAARIRPRPLTGAKSFWAFAFTFGLFFISFLLPALQLCFWGWAAFDGDSFLSLAQDTSHSLSLSFLAASFIVVCAFFLTWMKLPESLMGVLTLGYGLPGMVIAVLTLQVMSFSSIWIYGGVLFLILGYMIRFLSLGLKAVKASFSRMHPHWDWAAASLGVSPMAKFLKLYWPLSKEGLFLAFLLIFVEVVKELPMTLLLRPLNWDTLAVRVFSLTSEGQWEQAAIPALMILFLGLGAAAFLSEDLFYA